MRCLAVLFLFATILAAQAPKPDQKGRIHGVVKDTTGAPASAIEVQLTHGPGPGDPTVFTTDGIAIQVTGRPELATTNEAGSYAFAGLTPATYSLKAERGTDTKVVKLDAGQEVTVDFVIPANPTISGRVLDQNKDPVIDALVWLLRPEYRNGVLRSAIVGPRATGADGSYSFDANLEVNRRYYLLVDLPTPAQLPNRDPIEVPTYFPSATRMDDAIAVILQPGEGREHVDIKIAVVPFYCVDGKIQRGGKPAAVDFDITETPLAGAIGPLAGAVAARLRGRSGEDGKYHFCGLPSGSYRLSTWQGFTEFTIAGSDVAHIDLWLDAAYPHVQMDWDEPLVTPEFPKLNPEAEELLHRFASLMGLGDSPSADDLEKLALRLLQSNGKDTERNEAFSKLQGESDFGRKMGNLMGALAPLRASWGVNLTGIENGSYFGPDSESVPAGDYIVTVGLPQGSYVKKITFNDINVAGGVLRLAPAQTGTLRILVARGTGELGVAVADADGKPVANATVVVVPESVTSVPALSRTHTLGLTDQNGNLTLQSLAPGKYKVLATSQTIRWEVPEDLEKVLLVMFQAKDVELDAKAPAQITLAPIPIF